MVGGGRRTQVLGNQFAGCEKCIAFDDRGETWQTEYCQPGGYFNQDLDSYNYQKPPFCVCVCVCMCEVPCAF